MGRPHTAALTIPFTLLGAVVAGVWDPVLLALLGLWVLGFHYFGFFHNNLHDYPHDKVDPSKQHFPLVSGAIQLKKAWTVWIAGTAALYLLGLGFVAQHPSTAAWSLAALHVALVTGIGYNVASKRWKGAPFLISVSFAALPVFAYAVGTDRFDPAAAWYVPLYGFALMLHEIAYGGYLKDLAPDPVNWLRAMGARAEPVPGSDAYRYVFPPAVQAWAWISRLLCVGLAAYWVLQGPEPVPLLGTALAGLWAVGLLGVFARLAAPGEVPRQRKVGLLAGSEILAYFLLLATLQGQLGLAAPAFYLAPLVWFVAWNYALWGRALAPKV